MTPRSDEGVSGGAGETEEPRGMCPCDSAGASALTGVQRVCASACASAFVCVCPEVLQ